MNEFLKTKEQILQSTEWLKSNGYISHPISCKDWELKNFTEALEDGDLLDAGADGSFILHNAVIKGIKGNKLGIDLAEVTGSNKAEGVEYMMLDLTDTGLPDNSFDTICCASVIEHQVNFDKFVDEVNRLLRHRGKLLLSFDFWEPKPSTENMKLYSLDWNILGYSDVVDLLYKFAQKKVFPTSTVNWETKDAVINDRYCSPVQGVEYTFGLLEFYKN